MNTLPSEIFSPESAGSRKTNKASADIRTQGWFINGKIIQSTGALLPYACNPNQN